MRFIERIFDIDMKSEQLHILNNTPDLKKKAKFEKYKQNKSYIVQCDIPIKHIALKKKLRPLLRAILFMQRKIKGQTIELLNGKIPEIGCPIVFAVSHIGKYDFEIVNEIIPQHFHVIASDFMNMTGNINGLFMEANGVIFMDIDSKEDRENSRKMMLKVLEQGDNMMIFPEGVWNLSQNEIIRDIHFGVVDIALEKSAVIIPIAVEQYGKRFVVNIGKVYNPSITLQLITDIPYFQLNETDERKQPLKLQIKVEAARELRDRLATLKFEIWEREGITHRADIPYGYWNQFIKDRVSEWTGFSMSELIRNGSFPPDKRKYNTMLNEISKMKISKWNEFLFKKNGENK